MTFYVQGDEKAETAWFDYALSALQDEDGSVVAVLSVSPETTVRYALERRLTGERVRAEEQLRALNADFERQVTERALGRSRTWVVSPKVMGVINAEGHFEQSSPPGRRFWTGQMQRLRMLFSSTSSIPMIWPEHG